jgi:hypothetical protein
LEAAFTGVCVFCCDDDFYDTLFHDGHGLGYIRHGFVGVGLSLFDEYDLWLMAYGYVHVYGLAETRFS